jgi:hypothetical protein
LWCEPRWILSLVFLDVVVLGTVGLLFGQETSAEKRHVTVADGIEMTRVAGTGYPAVRPKNGFAVFSPNGLYFAIVLSKGNIEKNTNDYSLLLFRTAEVSHGPTPRLLTSFSTSSNREGIFDLRWSTNNDTLFFLGTRANEATQLYTLQCSSGELRRLTNHETSLVSYGVSEENDTIAYAAESPETQVIDANVLRHGLHITTERVWDVLRGISRDFERELFIVGGGVRKKRLLTNDPFDSNVNDLYLSPNGRYLVVKTDSKVLPEGWRLYQDESIQAVFRQKLPKGTTTRVLRYELIDVKTGEAKVLLDSPATFASSDVLWAPDSKSIILGGIFLPLTGEDPAELQARRSNKFVVEIRLPSMAVSKITQENLRPVRWDLRTNVVEFRSRQNQREAVCYRKSAERWEHLTDTWATVSDSLPEIIAEQDLNEPPRIVAVNTKTKETTSILDLNPQFAGLAFGREEEISWKDRKGDTVRGGFYFPPNYVPDKRYPLVIQTHGFVPHTFVIDGTHITASAAQPLASKGIAVLQIADIFYDSVDTPEEPERAMRAYESAIEYLNQRGLIDPSQVGIMGFSRTALFVKYALTHSSRHFAAAIVCDGVDAGYFQYLMDYNADPRAAAEFESIIGAAPFGAGLALWRKNSPGFLLDRVGTPLQIQALGPSSIFGEWEWFEGLTRLEKPVDMVYLPAGSHVLVKPWDRIVSQEGALDWFSFWLKGEEDPDPEKAAQYSRWKELRTRVSNSVSRD